MLVVHSRGFWVVRGVGRALVLHTHKHQVLLVQTLCLDYALVEIGLVLRGLGGGGLCHGHV